MNRFFEASICWLLRRHKWRRLHKAETAPGGPVNLPVGNYRICDRCGATRIVRQRKAAV